MDPKMSLIRNKIAQLKMAKSGGDYHATELIEHHPEGMGMPGGSIGSNLGAFGLTSSTTYMRQGPTDVMIGLSGDSSGLLVPARTRDMLPRPPMSVYNPAAWK